MANSRRLNVTMYRGEALRVSRLADQADHLVYVFLCDKKLLYPSDKKSRIAYIGTTASGVWRLTASASERASRILGERGVNSFEARILTCTPRQRVLTWHKLERAMLLEFREVYGRVPICNTHGKSMVETDEFEYFARSRVRDILEELS